MLNKIKTLISTKDIKDYIFLREFKDDAQEKRINERVKKNISRKMSSLGLSGKVYIVNKNRMSIKEDTTFSYFKFIFPALSSMWFSPES